MTTFDFRDPRTPSQQFVDGYISASEGVIAVDVYEGCLRGEPSAGDLGYLAGLKARFGELPHFEHRTEDGDKVVVGPKQ